MSSAPPSPPRPARPRRAVRVAGLLLLAATFGTPLAAHATTDPGGPVTPVNPATPGGAGAVRGVLDRLSVETSARPGGPGRRSAALTAWVRSGDRRWRIADGPVAAVPTGARVLVILRPATRPGDPGEVRGVASVTVLGGATARAVPHAAGTAHAVTVVLALPAGTRADGTTTAQVSAAVGAAARFWTRESGGRIAFQLARAVGWTHLTHGCTDVWALWDEVRDRVDFVPGPRRHLLVYVPATGGCPSGLGTVAPTPDTGGFVLVEGTTTGLIAHELGHNLGLGHSDALACDRAADAAFTNRWPASCTHQDYGDWYDVMGISWDELGTLSTAHAYRLGLLGAGDVLSVTGPARAVLHPVSGRSGPRSLRITDPDGAEYVVEFRPAAGSDAWIGSGADWRGLHPGVLVRRVDPEDPTRTLLLDATPSPTAQAPADHDEPLVAGQALTTGSGRVTIRVESLTPGTATVVVGMDGASPAVLAGPGGRLVNGAEVTVGDAPAAWAAAGAR